MNTPKFFSVKILKNQPKSAFLWMLAAFLIGYLLFGLAELGLAQSSSPEQDGSVGLSGQISAPPPTSGASISFPTNNQDFSNSNMPVTVTGICPSGLLVKLFKNDVFAGSTICKNSSFSIQIDLFVGSNKLIAHVYDDLDQAGPVSNTVTVLYNPSQVGAPPRVSLTSNYAKRGVNPNSKLEWPIILSGGSGPYALSVDWGDGSEPVLFSESFAGTLNLDHSYKKPGVYNVIIKAVDQNGSVAFLQVVAIVNGPVSQTDSEGQTKTEVISQTKIIWWPALLLIPFLISTFWLGKRHMLYVMKRRILNGEHPFSDL